MRKLALGLGAYKVALLGFVAALPWLWPDAFNLGNFASNFHWPPDAVPSYAALFSTWDAQHFLYLSRNGYQPGALSNNFYPLWPWFMRAGAILCGGRHLVSGLLLSNLFSLAALVLLHAYIKEARGARTADSFLLFLLAYPGAFFLGLPFSESLFLLLVAVLFVCLAREHTAGAAAAAFLLPLCRPQGIFAAIPLWIYLWNRRHRRAEDWAAAIAPLAGVAAYFAVMLGGAGDALEGFKTYRDLFPEAPGPLQLLDLGRFARAFAGVTAWHDIFGSAMDRAWFLLFLACLPALWKRDRLLFAYALPMGLVPAMTLSFVSYTRHLLLVFPVFLVLAEFFQNRPPVLRRAVLAAAWAFQLFLLARHANNYWVA